MIPNRAQSSFSLKFNHPLMVENASGNRGMDDRPLCQGRARLTMAQYRKYRKENRHAVEILPES